MMFNNPKQLLISNAQVKTGLFVLLKNHVTLSTVREERLRAQLTSLVRVNLACVGGANSCTPPTKLKQGKERERQLPLRGLTPAPSQHRWTTTCLFSLLVFLVSVGPSLTYTREGDGWIGGSLQGVVGLCCCQA
jgi:hypothetical protein